MCFWPNPVTNNRLLFVAIKLLPQNIGTLFCAIFPELQCIFCDKVCTSFPFLCAIIWWDQSRKGLWPHRVEITPCHLNISSSIARLQSKGALLRLHWRGYVEAILLSACELFSSYVCVCTYFVMPVFWYSPFSRHELHLSLAIFILHV